MTCPTCGHPDQNAAIKEAMAAIDASMEWNACMARVYRILQDALGSSDEAAQ